MPEQLHHSEKNNRTYLRGFDYDEARRLHAEGWSYGRLAERYAVSAEAVRYACDENAKATLRRHIRAHYERAKVPCLGGCGRLVPGGPWKRSGYCQECGTRLRAQSTVRELELWCYGCRQWKADDEFGAKGPKVRRGRRARCRACEAAERKAHRHENAVREREVETLRRKGPEMAKWQVMRQDSAHWSVVGVTEAATRERAIEKLADAEGDYIAVSAAQCKPMRVRRSVAFRITSEEPEG